MVAARWVRESGRRREARKERVRRVKSLDGMVWVDDGEAKGEVKEVEQPVAFSLVARERLFLEPGIELVAGVSDMGR